MNQSQVAVIVGDAVENLKELASAMPVWAPDIPKYRTVAESVWATNKGTSLTLYHVDCNQSEQQELLTWLDSIELHHPNWEVLQVHGLPLSKDVELALKEVGVREIIEIQDGFRASKVSL